MECECGKDTSKFERHYLVDWNNTAVILKKYIAMLRYTLIVFVNLISNSRIIYKPSFPTSPNYDAINCCSRYNPIFLNRNSKISSSKFNFNEWIETEFRHSTKHFSNPDSKEWSTASNNFQFPLSLNISEFSYPIEAKLTGNVSIPE